MSEVGAVETTPRSGPHRVQQRRTKGWRKPENTVSVARPSKWGNPHRVGDDSGFYGIPHDAYTASYFYRHDLELGDGIWWEGGYRCLTIEDVRRELAGKNLMCFCPLDQPCHADVLLELANGGEDV